MRCSARFVFAWVVSTAVPGAVALADEAPPLSAAVSAAQSFTIDSKALGETRRINVYLPADYAAGAIEFPVLYMPDGGIKEDFPHVVDAVKALVDAGRMRSVIVVGIENTERRRDLTGPTQVPKDKTIAPHVGGSAAFRTFIRSELIPTVRQRYRTTTESGIVGESLAGLFVYETFLFEPAMFDRYVAISPSVWWNDSAAVRDTPARLKQGNYAHKFLFMTSADEADIVAGTRNIDAALHAAPPAGLAWVYAPRPDQQHGTIYRAVESSALQQAFPPGPMRQTGSAH